MTRIDSAPAAMQQNATGCNIEISQPQAVDDNTGNGHDLSPRQLEAIDMLLQGHADPFIAQQLGIHRVTLYRWRTLHAPFRAELLRQRRLLWQQAADRLRSLISPAIDILQTQMADPKTALRAAATLLRFAAPRRLDPPAPTDTRSDFHDIVEATLVTHPTPDDAG